MLNFKSRVGIWTATAVAAACLCCNSAPSADRSASEVKAARAELQEVVVTGDQPGPALWQVSRGDHVLWVLGTVPVVPRGMKWKAEHIEKILASSQALVSNPGIRPDSNTGFGFVFIIGLLPALIGVEKLPDGATLQQVLQPAIYSRWVIERQKHLGDSLRFERLRPFIAANKLADAARKQAGLSDDREVISFVRKLANKYRLAKVDAEYHIFIKDPKTLIKKFKKTFLDESTCFRYLLDELDYSLAESTLQASAWATGDEAALKSSLARKPADPCWQGFRDNPIVKDLGTEDIVASVDDAWLRAAEKSLSENERSFALLDMNDVLLPSGLLAMLKAKGYTVLGP